LFSLIGLNILFIITCIPIITIPASITAMSRITATMVQDKNHFLFADYFKAFKRDFVESLLCGLMLGGLILAFGFAAWFYYGFAVDGSASKPFFTVIAAIAATMCLATIMTAIYLFPMLSMVELKKKALLTNSFRLAVTNLKRSIPALLFVGFFEVLLGFMLFPQSSVYIFFAMFSLTNLITSYLVVPTIEARVLEKPQTPGNPTEDDLDSAVIGEFPELESAELGEFPELDELDDNPASAEAEDKTEEN